MNNLCKLALIGALVTGCSERPAEDVEWSVAAANEAPRTVEYAAGYVIYGLAQQISPSVQSIRRRCDNPTTHENWCDDNGTSLEAIIGLLGAGGEETTPGLLKMMAIRLDAGASESRSCEIGKRGKSLLPALRSLDARRAAGWCQAEFGALRKRQLSNVTDVTASQVCRPASEIERDRQEWIEAFETGDEGCGSE